MKLLLFFTGFTLGLLLGTLHTDSKNFPHRTLYVSEAAFEQLRIQSDYCLLWSNRCITIFPVRIFVERERSRKIRLKDGTHDLVTYIPGGGVACVCEGGLRPKEKIPFLPMHDSKINLHVGPCLLGCHFQKFGRAFNASGGSVRAYGYLFNHFFHSNSGFGRLSDGGLHVLALIRGSSIGILAKQVSSEPQEECKKGQYPGDDHQSIGRISNTSFFWVCFGVALCFSGSAGVCLARNRYIACGLLCCIGLVVLFTGFSRL
jgi:hypothetical protein